VASLLNWLGNELHKAENAIGGAVHGAEHAAQSVASHPVQAAQQAYNVATHPAQSVGRYVAPRAADFMQNFGGVTARGINSLDHNYSLPVVGNVGNAVGGLISAPAVTMRHSGQLLQGQNPYRGMNLPTAAGAFGVDALNAATLGKGGPLARIGENAAERVAGNIGNQLAKKAIGNTVKTTLTAAPITAGYGAAGTLAAGDSNPVDIAKNAALGLAAAPVLGLAHGAMPIGGAGTRGVTNELRAGLPQIQNQAGHVPMPGSPEWKKAIKNSAPGATPELSDASMKVKSSGLNSLQAGKPIYLSDLIKHKDLPDFLMNPKDPRALKVAPRANIAKAVIDKNNGVIHIPTGWVNKIDTPAGRSMLMEEVQHSIDWHAGRVSGTTPAQEQAMGGSQAYQDAANAVGKLKPQVDELRQLVENGNLTPEEAASHPVAQAYAKAAEVEKSLRSQLPTAEEANASYRANPGEQLGSTVGDRSGMTQQQLRDNPLGLPLVQETNPYRPAFSMSETTPEKRAPQTLNTTRLNISDEARGEVNALSAPDELSHLSNKEVEQLSRSAGIDTKSHSLDQQKQIIAQQLNARKQLVSLTNAADEKLKQGDLSGRAELLRQIAELGRTSTEQGASVARQLQARRILANEMDTPMQRVFKLLDNAGVNPDTYIEKAASVNFENAPEVVRFYRSLVPAKAGDWLDLVRYNSMLSSPLTQIVNITSTAGNIAQAPIEKTIAGLLDAGRVAIKGGERKYAIGEGKAFVKGAAKSLPQAVSDFRRTLNELELDTHANAGIDDGRLPVAVHGDRKMVDALTLPMRVLSAFDAANKALVRGGSRAGLGLRESKGMGIKGNKELIASDEAAYRTFNRPLGDKSQGYLFRGIDEVTNLVMKARSSKNPVVKYPATFTLPFVRIGVNLLKTGTEYSPFGVGSIPGALNKTEQLSKVIMGTATMGMAAGLLGQGRLTWAEPTNQKQKDEFRAAGMQPYSVKFGNTWVSFAKLPPILSFNLAFVAGLDDTMKNSKLNQSGTDNLLTAVAKYGNFLADQSYYKSLGDALSAVKGDKEKFAQLVGNYPQQIVPYRAFGGWLATMTDDTQRKINTDAGFAEKQVQSLFMNIPGLRETVPARTDSAGNPIAAQHPVINAFNPARISTEDPTHAQNLADMQQKSLDTANNKILKKQGVANGETLGGTDTLAKSQTRVDEAKKNFAKDLSPDSQKVILNYARLTDEGRKKFSDNPKNDYNLAVAKYENDKLKGNITDEEDFKRQNELGKQRLTSDYSKEVNQLYGMSKTSLNAFLSQHPEKQGLVNDVLALDQKLADNKFISKTKFGGTVAFKAKGGKKGRKGKSGGSRSMIASTVGINKLLRSSTVKAHKVHSSKAKVAKVKLPKTTKIVTEKKIA
jgi:hypothetical protein